MRQSVLGSWGLLVSIMLLTPLAFLPMDALPHMLLAMLLLAVMLVCIPAAQFKDIPRIIVLVFGIFLILRYLVWRGLYTIILDDPFTMFAVFLLFFAELYSASLHVMGCFVNISPLKRPLLSLSDLPHGSELPSVDVFVPSYNEDARIVEITLRAAAMIKYPHEKLRVYLLDDGGTTQKLSSPDPEAAASAKKRRGTLMDICREIGVTYLARENNERAKAGNINYALARTNGDLVVIFDADHVPTMDFLDHTVPWFVRHDDVFLVQTPHFMLNPDPIERNLLRGIGRMPSENDMFYQTIHRGLDFWSASFFCGSAAVLRRRHLDEVGGLAGDSITEDAETAYELHRRGYRSIYVDRPMVAGLAPETFTGFVTQRMRWAQGMVQILLLKRPFMAPGLTWYQRIGYMSSILFWLFPLAKVIYLFAPLAYIIFGIHVYNASLAEIFGYTMPHILASYMVTYMLFGRTRWPLISELYELMQCFFSFTALIKVFVNPRAPSFAVTPKGDTMEKDFISPLATHFYVLIAILLVGFAFGGYRLWAYPMTRDLTIVVLAWNLFNLLIALATLGALLETRQQRMATRIRSRAKGRVTGHDIEVTECSVMDISAGGCRLFLRPVPVNIMPGKRLSLCLWSPVLQHHLDLPIEVRTVFSRTDGLEIGVMFAPGKSEEFNKIIALNYGDSSRWVQIIQRRSRPIAFLTACKIMMRQMWKPVTTHLGLLPGLFARQLANSAQSDRQPETR